MLFPFDFCFLTKQFLVKFYALPKSRCRLSGSRFIGAPLIEFLCFFPKSTKFQSSAPPASKNVQKSAKNCKFLLKSAHFCKFLSIFASFCAFLKPPLRNSAQILCFFSPLKSRFIGIPTFGRGCFS